MGYANAQTYAPDDAARDLNGDMIPNQQSVYQPTPEHPAGAAVQAPLSRWLALALIGAFALFWSKRR